MTTFQLILTTIFQVVGSLLPFSSRSSEDFFAAFLGWPMPSVELQYLISSLILVLLVFFFRFDWLGIISAFLKSIVRPKSLNNKERTLDQQIVMFLGITCIPSILFKLVIAKQWVPIPEHFFTHPFSMLIGALLSCAFLQMGLTLNRRLRGLNHLRLTDSILVGLMLLLSAHPSFSIVLLAFSAFAICHYHSEPIFKYSFIILTLHLLAHTLTLGSDLNIGTVLRNLGPMNATVITFLTVALTWITLENFQKSFIVNSYEKTFKFFRWFQILIAIGYGAVMFVQRGSA